MFSQNPQNPISRQLQMQALRQRIGNGMPSAAPPPPQMAPGPGIGSLGHAQQAQLAQRYQAMPQQAAPMPPGFNRLRQFSQMPITFARGFARF